MKNANSKPAGDSNSLESLRREVPRSEHPAVVSARQTLERVQANAPVVSAELAHAEALLAQAESAAAEAASDGEPIDQRALTTARSRVAEAESACRINKTAVRQAKSRLVETEGRVGRELLARCQAAYRELLPELDAKVAAAAAVNKQIAEIATVARTLLSGDPEANTLVHWDGLIGPEGRCRYAYWRESVERNGFPLPPLSDAYTLPTPPRPTAPSYGRSGVSNMEPREFRMPISPSGQPVPESRNTSLIAPMFGTTMSAVITAIGSVLR